MPATELLAAAIGSMLLGLGIAATGAWALNRGRPDRTLVLFGLWCGLYGARLILEQPALPPLVGLAARTADYAVAFITYTINVPIALFLEALIGPGWKRSVTRVRQLHAIYAAAGIAGDVILGEPRAMMPVNSWIVLVGLIVALANLWRSRERLSSTFRTPAIVVAATILMLFVTNENLGRPVLPAINIEPVGLFAFVLTLGYSVIGRIFERESELAGVRRELETARRIQAGLLPERPPVVDGVQLAARYIPLTAVAGDLYDFVQIAPSRVGILVADVSGHGVPAALVASMVKLAFTTQSEHAADPARVLGAMNRILCRNARGTFVTAVYAVIDTDRGTVAVANAGHPALLIARKDRTVQPGIERGFMLGLAPDAAYAVEEWPVAEGDRVLLYTDGMTEALNPAGEFLDEERLASWMFTADGASADGVADALLSRLKSWRSAPTYDDDVSFVVAARHDVRRSRLTSGAAG